MDRPVDEKPRLHLTRRYAVAPARIWRAWTDPQALSAWFGPGGPNTVSLAELDVRPGGRYRVRFHTQDGEQHEIAGVYQEVVPERRLVFSWAWHTTPDRVSRVALDLRPVAEGTELDIVHERFFDEAAREAHQRGWTATLVKLEAWLQASGSAQSSG